MNRILSIIILLTTVQLSAQTTYTLQQCIDTALAHNIPVKQSALQMETSRIAWNQSRSNLLPSLGMDISHGINTGRSIDPFTNTYVNQTVNRAAYSIRSDVVVFNGGTLQNRIRENATAYEASRMEWQQSKDNLVLNVILAYMQVLSSEDQVQVAITQSETSRQALERLEILNNQGAIRPSDLTDLKGQLMNDQLLLINAKNQLESSKLNLLQWMNKPYDSTIQLERINVDEFMTVYHQTPVEVYQNALENFALVKAAELRTKSAEYAVKAAKGQRFPTLSFGAGMNTNYSSLARDLSQQKINYGSQIRNNRFGTFGLGLVIPIFNSSIAKNRVKISGISLVNNELAEEETERQLRQDIDQAYLNMTNAYERYKVLQEQVDAYQESFRAAEIRFQSGVGTSIDYLTPKDRLDRAKINLVSARYDFVLRKKILDYYMGK